MKSALSWPATTDSSLSPASLPGGSHTTRPRNFRSWSSPTVFPTRTRRSRKATVPGITFIEAAPLLEGHTLPPGSRFTRAVYLRLTLDEILADIDHAVYLDSDISPSADVSPMLALRPKVAPVIAAYDLVNALNSDTRTRLGMSESAPCFNSGVVVIDLKAVRNERIFADALEFARQHPDRCLSVDQDALNVVLDGRWQVLDWRWNAMTYRTGQFPSAPFTSGISPVLGKALDSRTSAVLSDITSNSGAPTWPNRHGPGSFRPSSPVIL